ncbi:hypothetical protein QAD02_003197 [Eretmocerus hayati]|uniref:Uncharacterized protein n=1 Tax=Eretmocerus hayati TaxID=131215 RepID=A0ACC2NM36_9HYME|nr:hypothetical protein QAD02_003197 [Eretmocerus hayati]
MEPVNNNNTNESGASISDISLEPSIDPEEDTSKIRQWKKFKTLPDFSESKLTEMLELRNQLFTSGLVKETLGRHNEITVTETSKVSDYDRKIYKLIFEDQKCNLLESIELLQVKPLSMCCQAAMTKLDRDPVLICENTRNHFSYWLDERKSRVTGTTGYGLFTEATEYGRKNEAPAREIFKSQNPNIEVIETGLIICKSLPWIACTPDGVIVHDGKIVSLLEIKCFVNGKSEGIRAVVEKQISKGCLRRRNNVVVMRERNRYYGQVQLGMALLNVGSCKFVLYSSFDKNIFVVDVPKDRLFLVKMLRRLKDLYYATILPGICALESDNHTPSSHADERHLIVKYEDTKPQKPKPPVKPNKAMCTSTPKKPKKVIIPLSPRSSKVRI